LVWQGLSPYSDETALQIQQLAYGRPAQAGEHELRVAYPLYSILIFLPFSFINDYTLARAVWMTVLEVSLVLLAFLNLRLTNWKPGFLTGTFFFIFSLLSYHALRPLINGNAVILIALGFTGAMLAYRSKFDELAAILMALTTIKPQLSLLISIYMVLHAIFQKRWRFVIWFGGTMTILILISVLLLPDWMLQNLREIIRYPGYNPPGTLQAALKIWFPAFGKRLGTGFTIFLSLLLLAEWVFSRRGGYRAFLWCACLTLVVSQWIGIQTDPGNFIILYPALALIFSTLSERWKRAGEIISLGIMLLLLLGLWAFFLATVEYGAQPQQSPLMFLPLPGLLIPGLYWVRWWVIRPGNIMFEWLSNQETLSRR